MEVKGIVSQVIPFDERNDYWFGSYDFDESKPVDIVNVVPYPKTGYKTLRRLFSRFSFGHVDSRKPYSDMAYGPNGMVTVLCEQGHGFSVDDTIVLDLSILKA